MAGLRSASYFGSVPRVSSAPGGGVASRDADLRPATQRPPAAPAAVRRPTQSPRSAGFRRGKPRRGASVRRRSPACRRLPPGLARTPPGSLRNPADRRELGARAPQRDDWRVAGARGARDFLKGFSNFPPLAGAKTPIFSRTWAHCTMRQLPVRFPGPVFFANGRYFSLLCVRGSPPPSPLQRWAQKTPRIQRGFERFLPLAP